MNSRLLPGSKGRHMGGTARLEHGVHIVDGRVVGPTLADPGMAKKVKEAQHRLFPDRKAALAHFRKQGVLTPSGNLTKAYGGR
ncbi:MAG: hypothetical protein KKC79_08710 [Gammaproteobacteria bacterium]|nr:hypothetical protein [Gammaproteobacteria bacterium]MBU1444565.1 hypothetical protein [Gammaproteobacteria bacterium]MBU2287180.1 hypothetical protein [Gammaproteobacteria bacterium]MBU2408715.1 hypothetical protein [Gammaproteobacteria bacterium]